MNATAHRWRHLLSAVFLLLLCRGAGAGVAVESVPSAPGGLLDGGAYRALLIANQSYADPQRLWRDLRTPIADARALSTLLRERYGFADVQLLENATRRDILLALNELGKRVMPRDNVLIYYAGHGFLDPDTERGYWVPVDAAGADHTTFLRNSTIRDELSIVSGRARHTLLISDSCFSGTLLRSASRSISREAGSQRYYRQVASKKSVQILSAGGVEYVDDDYRASGHSPFTYFLLNSLNHNQRDLLAASELAAEVTRSVANNVEQIPQSGVLQGAGDEQGEFIFLRVDVQVKGVPRERVKVQVNIVDPDASGVAAPAADEPAGDAAGDPGRPLLPLPTL